MARKDVQVLATCDVDRNRRENARRHCNQVYADRLKQSSYNAIQAYDDFREVLARPDIDAVLIAVPYHWASHIAMAAMRAGKDVYCEKPMCVTMRESHCLARHGQTLRAHLSGRHHSSAPNTRQISPRLRLGSQRAHRPIEGSLCLLPPRSDVSIGLGYEASSPVPDGTDWDMWLGPLPRRPYKDNPSRQCPACLWAMSIGDRITTTSSSGWLIRT